VLRATWSDRGEVRYFRAPDERLARDVEERLVQLGAGDVRRDGVWVVQLDITRQQGQDAFNCAR